MVRVVLLLLLVSLAGCLDGARGDLETDDEASAEPEPMAAVAAPPADGLPTPMPDGPDMLDWAMRDCTFMYAEAQVGRANVQDALPEGFTAAGSGPTVDLGFEANQCSATASINGTVTGGGYGAVWVEVLPPPTLAADDGATQLFALRVVEPDDDRRAWLRDHGIKALDGDCGIGAFGPTRLATCWDNGNRALFNVHYGRLDEAPDSSDRVNQWTEANGDVAYWEADRESMGQAWGVGRLTVNIGGEFAAWFHGPDAPATITLGQWDYKDGSITHPAPRAS